MIITLYKNCILSDSYSEVFNVHTVDVNNKTCHDRYLDTLEHYVVNAPNVYVPQSGRITVELNLNGDAYQFNYMKLENEDNGFKRFCFIDSINVVNSLAIINYTEDVWSNYAPDMKIRKSLLTRSRIIDYGSYQIPFYSPGMDYQGNNALVIKEVFEKEGTTQNVKMICQLQLYKLGQQGEATERIVMEAFIISKVRVGGNEVWRYETTVSGAISNFIDTIKLSTTQQISFNDQTYYFEIYNMMVVPSTFNISVDIESGATPIQIYSEGNATYYFKIFQEGFYGSSNEIVWTNSKTLPTNFKQFMIGTMGKAYDIVQNGTSIEVKVGYYSSMTSFSLFLSIQNQIYEITSDFAFEIPITVQSADVTQQQATAREIAKFNAEMNIAKGSMKIAGGIQQAVGGGMMIATGIPQGIIQGGNDIITAQSNITGGIMDVIGASKQLEIANRSIYTTNKGISVSNNASLNAEYGIVIYEINPDNEIEVQANIDNAGYVVNEIVDNLFDTQTTGVANKYNVMQFDYVNLYGKFSQRVADVLREILNNGFKIWYDETAVNE